MAGLVYVMNTQTHTLTHTHRHTHTHTHTHTQTVGTAPRAQLVKLGYTCWLELMHGADLIQRGGLSPNYYEVIEVRRREAAAQRLCSPALTLCLYAADFSCSVIFYHWQVVFQVFPVVNMWWILWWPVMCYAIQFTCVTKALVDNSNCSTNVWFGICSGCKSPVSSGCDIISVVWMQFLPIPQMCYDTIRIWYY